MMLTGVLAGATTQSSDMTSNPGRPDAATVGIPGSSSEGCNVVTARARTRPVLICAATGGGVMNIICGSPASMEVSAGPLPLYETRTISTPARDLKYSADRLAELPAPPDE